MIFFVVLGLELRAYTLHHSNNLYWLQTAILLISAS
jgi:hypothetical protein